MAALVVAVVVALEATGLAAVPVRFWPAAVPKWLRIAKPLAALASAWALSRLMGPGLAVVGVLALTSVGLARHHGAGGETSAFLYRNAAQRHLWASLLGGPAARKRQH
mmetsp:Transcript_32461/g.103503  ORF Transcript_32461/g.103503 Transcript_32461/m.103503 type:complete len:108 (+) Transcript_32461:52-375(+)